MKKFRLFLLGLIISILSIGSFTFAGFVEFTDVSVDVGRWVPFYSINTNGDPVGEIIIRYSGVSKSIMIGKGCSSFDFNYGSIIGDGEIIVDGGNPCGDGFFTIGFRNTKSSPADISSISIENQFIISENSDSSNSSIFSDGYGTLTPAIDGLHDTVRQLIPYFIYIGFGILIVTLSFLCIRWLCIWMFGKINSRFNSKNN